MTDDEYTQIPRLLNMAEVFAKRPGMYMAPPVTYERVCTFLEGFNFALTRLSMATTKRDDSIPFGAGVAIPSHPGSLGQYAERLRAEGRLRWDDWSLTLLAEAIGHTGDELPDSDDLTEDQHKAAIQALVPLMEELFDGPAEMVERIRS